MAARKPPKPDYNGSLADYKESVKPASKKEKLYGQELGKIGRAAERGGPVNTVQQKMGAYSEQVMQNKAMRDMPVKRKVEDLGLLLGVSALTSPGTLRGIQSGVARGATAAAKIPTQIGPEVAALKNFVKGEQVVIRGMRGPGGQVTSTQPPYMSPSSYQMPKVVEPEGFVNPAQSLHSKLGNKPVLWAWDPKAKGVTESVLEYARKHEGAQIIKSLETLPGGGARPGALEVTKGAIGVVKVPSKSVYQEPVMPPWVAPVNPKTGLLATNDPAFYRQGGVAVTSPGQLVSSLTDMSKFKNASQVETALKALLKQQGVGTKTEQMLSLLSKNRRNIPK